jgi:hypothetical protein
LIKNIVFLLVMAVLAVGCAKPNRNFFIESLPSGPVAECDADQIRGGPGFARHLKEQRDQQKDALTRSGQPAVRLGGR